ncbi:putative F-box/LRR-repeat protein [Panicum miliaceum]|uniref:F-box/LRR-repeat protein n=1 Tax=Panicum miliaceum TaxID=4540 RepID=A0A3L6T7Y3_PANMI|nr:putative F-box/LRR-repeat protein [Panicum miliaceum]
MGVPRCGGSRQAAAPAAPQPRGRYPRGRAGHPRQPQGGPSRRFSLTWRDHLDVFSAVDDVLLPPGLDGLQEFELRYTPSAIDTDFPLNPAPLSVFRFSPTADPAHAHRALPPKNARILRGLPRTRSPTPRGTDPQGRRHLGEHSPWHPVQVPCPAELGAAAKSRVPPSPDQLPDVRSLGIWASKSHDAGMLQQVSIEDAPLFKRLFTDGLNYGEQIRVTQAPKLNILGYLTDCVFELYIIYICYSAFV